MTYTLTSNNGSNVHLSFLGAILAEPNYPTHMHTHAHTDTNVNVNAATDIKICLADVTQAEQMANMLHMHTVASRPTGETQTPVCMSRRCFNNQKEWQWGRPITR